MSAATTATIDYAEVYRQACLEHGCRANSAVLKTLLSAPTSALLHLNLRNNYVGPKGFGPLMSLIERCPTISTINLAGNGLDNACIDRLCEVLVDHLGIEGLDLSDNPITNDAGRPLMTLLERNRRIVRLCLDRVDIFTALADRIRFAVEENRSLREPTLGRGAGDGNTSPLAADSLGVSDAAAVVDARTGMAPKKATPSAPVGLRVSMTATNSSKVSGGSSTLKSSSNPRHTATYNYSNMAKQSDDAAGSNASPSSSAVITPKPPAPALAANENARLSNQQQSSMRAKYKQRREQQFNYSSIGGGGKSSGQRSDMSSDGAVGGNTMMNSDRSEASKAAERARYQLAMLEQADQRSAAVLARAEAIEASTQKEMTRQQRIADEAYRLAYEAAEADTAAAAANRSGGGGGGEGEGEGYQAVTGLVSDPVQKGMPTVVEAHNNVPLNEEGANSNNDSSGGAQHKPYRAFASDANNGSANSSGASGGGAFGSNSAHTHLPPLQQGGGERRFGSTVGPSPPPASATKGGRAAGTKRASISDVVWAGIVPEGAEEADTHLPYTTEAATTVSSVGSGVITNAAGQTVTVSKDPTVAPFVVPPTREEHFKALFDEGCEAYKAKDSDLAFLRWSEAAAFAQEHRNREWIAIVTSNMQRLSYDMLVADGQEALANGRLDEAEKHFNFGMDIALKAKNSVWETEMTKARRNVQYAVFQREQDNSTILFEKAVRAPDEVLSEEDLFLGPDGVRIVSHTSAFHNEWRRMLPIREALAGWVGASKVAARISGPSSRVLLDIVASSVLNVTQYFIKALFAETLNDDTVVTLPQQGTVRYRYEEAEALRRLWEEIVAETVPLNCPPFQALARCHIGHLCLALNRLSDAIQHFRAAVLVAEGAGDAALAAIALTYLSTVHHQARDYSDTERCLERAIRLWEAISGYKGGASSSATNNNNNGTKEGGEASAASPDGADPSVEGNANGDITLKHQALPNARAIQKGPLVPAAKADGITVGHVIGATEGDGGSVAVGVTPASSVVADALLQNIGASLRGSPFFRYVPQEVLRRLHRHCYHLMVSILVTPPRSKYLAALEVLELSLQQRFDDALAAKVKHNFTAKPTIDHISAVATSGKSMLVYLKTTTDFRWNIDKSVFEPYEYLHAWCVPESGDIAFSTTDVKEVTRSPSIASLVSNLGHALHINPLASDSSQQYQQQQQAAAASGSMSGSISTDPTMLSFPLSKRDWAIPLRALHAAIVEPLSSFIHSHNAYDCNKVLTIIPSEGLWAVPYGALLEPNLKTYWIETIAMQLSFSGIYSTFASLCSLQARERDAAKVALIKSPFIDPTDPMAASRKYGLAFPLDGNRSAEEVALVSEAIAAGMALGVNVNNGSTSLLGSGGAGVGASDHHYHAAASSSIHGAPTAPSAEDGGTLSNSVYRSAVLTRHHRIAEDAAGAKVAMVGSRLIHCAAPCVSSVTHEEECSTGGFCVTSGYGSELALLQSCEIGKLDLYAQMVTLSNTHVDPSLLTGLREGTLCAVRAFFAAGCPAVVAGLWCTPDMYPVDLFQKLYLLFLEPQQSARALDNVPSGPRPATMPRSAARRLNGGAANGSGGGGGGGNAAKIPIIKRRNKALAMAMAVRELLKEGDAFVAEGRGDSDGGIDFRNAPRHWAGYFLAGVGE